jgi:hypothetical protein
MKKIAKVLNPHIVYEIQDDQDRLKRCSCIYNSKLFIQFVDLLMTNPNLKLERCVHCKTVYDSNMSGLQCKARLPKIDGRGNLIKNHSR